MKNKTTKYKIKKKKRLISFDTPLSDIAMNYPLVAEHLTYEYGFHCLNCFLAEYETFEQGALVHGIEGDDLTKLLDEVNKIAEGIPQESPQKDDK